MSDRKSTRPIEMAADELKLQAWLAKAELDHPSSKAVEHHQSISVLAMLRDELRLQVALGKLEAHDEWHQHEGRWRKVMSMVGDTAHDVGEDLGAVLDDIRKGYARIKAQG